MVEFDCHILQWIHFNTRLKLDNLIWNFKTRSNVPIYENMFVKAFQAHVCRRNDEKKNAPLSSGCAIYPKHRSSDNLFTAFDFSIRIF